ncbi:MAG: ion transporter [bacterium]
MLNIFRLCRVLRIFRVGKYMSFLKEIWKAVRKNLYKYRIAFTLFFIVWLIGSFLVYSVENIHNPKFATIPDAMRWAIVTMGTV